MTGTAIVFFASSWMSRLSVINAAQRCIILLFVSFVSPHVGLSLLSFVRYFTTSLLYLQYSHLNAYLPPLQMKRVIHDSHISF